MGNDTDRLQQLEDNWNGLENTVDRIVDNMAKSAVLQTQTAQISMLTALVHIANGNNVQAKLKAYIEAKEKELGIWEQ